MRSRRACVAVDVDQVEQVSNTAAGVASYLTGTPPRRACVSVVVDQGEQESNTAAGVAFSCRARRHAGQRLRGRGPSGAGVERGCQSGTLVDKLPPRHAGVSVVVDQVEQAGTQLPEWRPV